MLVIFWLMLKGTLCSMLLDPSVPVVGEPEEVGGEPEPECEEAEPQLQPDSSQTDTVQQEAGGK